MIVHIITVTLLPHNTQHRQMDPVCSSPTVVTGYGSHFEKVDRQSHKINHTPQIHPHYSFSQLWMSVLHLTLDTLNALH